MLAKDPDKIRVLSFLTGDHEKNFRRQICDYKTIEYHKAKNPWASFDCSQLIDKAFWTASDADKADLVLLPMTGNDLTQLEELSALNKPSSPATLSAWEWLETAVVAVLVEDSLQDAVAAAQLDFDGIIAQPFLPEPISYQITEAIQRSQRRYRLSHRYNKLQRLLRTVNRNRRHLRNKVDLLCRDLVQSNVDLTGTLQDLQKAYTFQSELTGEFDMRFMLNKGLCQIKNLVDDSSAAIYICHSDNFDAHVVSSWYDQPDDINELEKLFSETVVEHIVQSRQHLLVADGGNWQYVSSPHRKMLAGLTVMAFPIIIDSELSAIMVLYRNADKPFQDRDKNAVAPLLLPFGRAIEAVQKLQHSLL